jgi:hypothetical protein
MSRDRRFESLLRTLGTAEMFTFEPHVRAVGGAWGFKHEDVYWIKPARTSLKRHVSARFLPPSGQNRKALCSKSSQSERH